MFDVQEAPPHVVEEDRRSTAAEDLVDELAALFFRISQLEARAASLLRQAGESEVYRRDGYSSLTAMLKHRMSLHPGEAHRIVTRANGLGDAPLASLAHEKGLLSGAQVDVLLAACFAAPQAYDGAEGELVSLALATPLVRDLRRQIDYWLERVDPDELAWRRHNVREMRALTLRRDGEMVRINGWVDIESGERLLASLEPGPAEDGDDRSTPARRADLLLEILDGASNRPGLTVLVSAETLLNGASGISETGNGTFLTVDEIQRLACDADLTRVIFGPGSRPLDVGRTRRLVTPAMRIALTARDLRCVFPGCDRPSRWCDAHHLVRWIDGGETWIDNLVLLCRHHHVLVHEAGWEIKGEPGDLSFHRPDGSELGADRVPVPTSPPSSTVQPNHPPPRDLIAAIREFHGLPPP